jgi:hypothetical protein
MVTPVNYAMPVREFAGKFHSPRWKAAMTLLRWLGFFIIASIATDLLKQIDLMPEALCTKAPTGLMCFTIRENVRILLTLLTGYLDNYLHNKFNKKGLPSGISPV